MISYSSEDLENSLKSLGVGEDSFVLVHSRLLSLGTLRGYSISEIPQQILNSFLRLVGKKGTIAVPSFSFEYCTSLDFSLLDTPASSVMGVFTEYVRQDFRSKRSNHPIQSLSAIGKLADEIGVLSSESAYGVGGAFEFVVNQKGSVVLLGCGVEAAAVIHFAEEKFQVPYRYYKSFNSLNKTDGSLLRSISYVRDLDINPQLDTAKIHLMAKREGLIGSLGLGSGQIHCLEAAPFVDFLLEELKKDPYVLLKK